MADGYGWKHGADLPDLGGAHVLVVGGEGPDRRRRRDLLEGAGAAIRTTGGIPEAHAMLRGPHAVHVGLLALDPRIADSVGLIDALHRRSCAVVVLLTRRQARAGAVRAAMALRVHDCLAEAGDGDLLDSVALGVRCVRLRMQRRSGPMSAALGKMPSLLPEGDVERVSAHVAAEAGLSETETVIAALLYLRLTNQEIGQQLNISGRTAGQHAATVAGKLGLSKRYEVRDHFHSVARAMGLHWD